MMREVTIFRDAEGKLSFRLMRGALPRGSMPLGFAFYHFEGGDCIYNAVIFEEGVRSYAAEVSGFPPEAFVLIERSVSFLVYEKWPPGNSNQAYRLAALDPYRLVAHIRAGEKVPSGATPLGFIGYSRMGDGWQRIAFAEGGQKTRKQDVAKHIRWLTTRLPDLPDSGGWDI